MRAVSIVLIAIVATGASADPLPAVSGASPTPTRARVGLATGVNVTTLSVSDAGAVVDQGIDPTLGLVVTGFVTLPAKPGFEVMVGAALSQKGAAGRAEDIAALNGRWFLVSYVELSALLRGRIPRAGVAPYGAVGVAAGVPIGATGETPRVGEMAKAQFTSTDLSAVMAGGLEIPFDGYAATVELRYVHGLTDSQSVEGSTEAAFRVVSLMGGVLF